MPQERDPNVVTSGLSKTVMRGGVRLEINIIRLETETDWTLEVVTPDGASTVWKDVFSSDDAAYAEFERIVTEEGVKAFLEPGNVIPFKR
jgi:hypothetical protein